MEIKTLIKFKVPKFKVPGILLHFPEHPGDKLCDVVEEDGQCEMIYYIDHWHCHEDQLRFLVSNGIFATPFIAVAPSVSHDRYAVYAEP